MVIAASPPFGATWRPPAWQHSGARLALAFLGQCCGWDGCATEDLSVRVAAWYLWDKLQAAWGCNVQSKCAGAPRSQDFLGAVVSM